MQARTISGIHHITAIAGDPQRNLDFYTSVLGLRLVKLTVNFDDPGTYHFYFGNASGTPGSVLTFFPWPGARRGCGYRKVEREQGTRYRRHCVVSRPPSTRDDDLETRTSALIHQNTEVSNGRV